MTKKLITVLMVALLIGSTSCIAITPEAVKGNGKVTTREFRISNFTSIDNSLNATINYSQTNESPFCEVIVDDNILPYLDIKIENGELVLQRKKEHKNVNLEATKFIINTNSKALNEIELAGSSNMNITTPLDSEKMEIDLAGACQIDFKEGIKISQLEVDIAGSGSVSINEGSIGQAKVNIAGSGTFDAPKCSISNMDVDISGNGLVDANTINKLTYDIAGSGTIYYYGDPIIKGSTSGSGNIKKR